MKIKARHILVDQEFEAKDLLKKIEEGKTFEELAATFSKCPSLPGAAAISENLGVVAWCLRSKKRRSRFAINDVSKPVRTQFGYHLIQRYA